jgi:DNA repair protein RecN (Recombination protein N)
LVTHSRKSQPAPRGISVIHRRKDKTKIELLNDEERLEKIARMLSGAAVTAEARAAAKRLMAEAAPQKKTRKRHDAKAVDKLYLCGGGK